MNYTKTYLFGQKKSKGTFDDFFDTEKYKTIQDSWDNNDYVHCDFVKDDNGILYIEAHHSKSPKNRTYHRLNYQNPVFGLDALDDRLGCELAFKLLENKSTQQEENI